MSVCPGWEAPVPASAWEGSSVAWDAILDPAPLGRLMTDPSPERSRAASPAAQHASAASFHHVKGGFNVLDTGGADFESEDRNEQPSPLPPALQAMAFRQAALHTAAVGSPEQDGTSPNMTNSVTAPGSPVEPTVHGHAVGASKLGGGAEGARVHVPNAQVSRAALLPNADELSHGGKVQTVAESVTEAAVEPEEVADPTHPWDLASTSAAGLAANSAASADAGSVVSHDSSADRHFSSASVADGTSNSMPEHDEHRASGEPTLTHAAAVHKTGSNGCRGEQAKSSCVQGKMQHAYIPARLDKAMEAPGNSKELLRKYPAMADHGVLPGLTVQQMRQVSISQPPPNSFALVRNSCMTRLPILLSDLDRPICMCLHVLNLWHASGNANIVY